MNRVKKIVVLILCLGFILGLALCFSACDKDPIIDNSNTDNIKHWNSYDGLSFGYVNAKDCEDGNIHEDKMQADMQFEVDNTYYMVIDFAIQAERNNSGTDRLHTNLEIMPSEVVDATIQDAATSDFKEEIIDKKININLSYKIPELAETVRQMRLIIQLRPTKKHNGDICIKLSFESENNLNAVKTTSASDLIIGDYTKGLEYTKTEDGGYAVSKGTAGNNEQIVIPLFKDDRYVTSISNEAFRECSSLTNVTIPDSVTSIGYSAFSDCPLTSVTIPNKVTDIGDNAFKGCSSLTGVYITNVADWCKINFGNINSNPLSYAKNLYLNNQLITDLDIPNTVTSIGNYVFANSSPLKTLTLADSITSIGESAFTDCSSLTSIKTGNGLTSVGNFAFEGCGALTGVYIKDIADWCKIAFSNDSSNPLYYAKKLYLDNQLVTDLVIPDNITSIGNYVFANCSSITSVTIPNSVTSVGFSAFNNCNSLKGVYITDIGAWCNIKFSGTYTSPLYYAKNLYLNNQLITDIVIPNTVTSIADCAFYYCSSLNSLTIPDTVTSIADTSFEGCTGIIDLTCPTIAIPYISKENLQSVVITSGENIVDKAFSNCSKLTSVTIPDSVTSIGDSAFTDCSSLANLTCPTSTIPYMPRKNLQKIVITSGETIKERSFYNCNKLTSVTIPSSITSIDKEAFTKCYRLVEIYNLSNLNITKGSSDNGGVGEYALDIYTDLSQSSKLTTVNDYIIHTNGYKETLVAYWGDLTETTIMNGVNSIGKYAFYDCSMLTSVTIPDSVTSINYAAFYGCSSLTSITLPFVGAEMFNHISNTHFGYIFGAVSYTDNQLKVPAFLKEVLITGGSEISNNAFADCDSLTNVTIPDSVRSIGSRAFSNCHSLTSINIPKGVSYIGEYAFMNCESLTSFFINDLTSWCNIKFCNTFSNPLYWAKNLYIQNQLVANLVIPNTVTAIGDYAFSGCLLTSLTIGNSVKSIGFDTFKDCNRLVEVYNLSSLNITKGSYDNGYAGYYALDIYTDLSQSSKLTLSNGHVVHTNGKNKTLVAYMGNSTEITIPNGVTAIGDYAFYTCSSLTSVTIPESIISIGKNAFTNCYRLVEVYNLSKLNITKGSNDNGYIGYYALDIYTDLSQPSKLSLVDDFVIHMDGDNKTLVAYIGKSTGIILPDGVNVIGEKAFYKCQSLTNISLPNSVKSIGDYAFGDCCSLNYNEYKNGLYLGNVNNPYMIFVKVKDRTITSIELNDYTKFIHSLAFYYCRSLISISLPNGLINIGNNAFYECNSLTSIIIPNSVTAIEKMAFSGCSALRNIIIPNSVKTIGNSAFNRCSSLTSITIPYGITTIGDFAFSFCSSLTSITIPNSVSSIGNSAFWDCCSLKNITIPNSVTSIGVGAFHNCSALTSIIIPDGVSSIGNSAFSGCSSLTSIIIPDGVSSIGNSAFSYCSSLTSINVPDGVSSIGDSAFNRCSSLTSIILPDSVTSIGSYAFAYCSSLSNIIIPDSVSSIGERAFSDCSSLTSIIIPDGVSSIGDYAFGNCSLLKLNEYENGLYLGNDNNPYLVLVDVIEQFNTSFSINTNTKFIYNSVFQNCSLKNITLPDSVTSIGTCAFSHCYLLSITIPNSVSFIGDSVFEYSQSLTSINFEGTKSEWNAIKKDSAWNDNSKITVIHCSDGDLAV